MNNLRLKGDGHDGRPNVEPIALDGHGSAALLLVESLIHGLIARSVLTVDAAIEIIEVAADVEREEASSRSDGNGGDRGIPSSLLAPLADSLRLDLKD